MRYESMVYETVYHLWILTLGTLSISCRHSIPLSSGLTVIPRTFTQSKQQPLSHPKSVVRRDVSPSATGEFCMTVLTAATLHFLGLVADAGTFRAALSVHTWTPSATCRFLAAGWTSCCRRIPAIVRNSKAALQGCFVRGLRHNLMPQRISKSSLERSEPYKKLPTTRAHRCQKKHGQKSCAGSPLVMLRKGFCRMREKKRKKKKKAKMAAPSST